MKKWISTVLTAALLFGIFPSAMVPAQTAGTVTITQNPKNWQVVENVGYTTQWFTERTDTLYNHKASTSNCTELIFGSTLIQTDGGSANGAENDVYAQFTIDKSADIYVAARMESWGTPLPLSDTYLPWLRENTTASFGGYEQVMYDEDTPAVLHLSSAIKYHLYKKHVEVPQGQTVTVSLGGVAKDYQRMYAVFVQFEYPQKAWPEWQVTPAGSTASDKLKVRFRPVDNYTCEQNPPDFSWWKVDDAVSYDLIVCRDRELTDIAYEKRGITDYYYNFETPFAPGVYYWSVRYNLPQRTGWPAINGEWQPARRFLVEDDAFLFPVPDVTQTVNSITRQAHPRFFAGAGTKEEFRSRVKASGLYGVTVTELNAIMNDWRGKGKLKTYLEYDFKKGVGNTNPFWGEFHFYAYPRMDAATLVYSIDPSAVVSGKSVKDYAVTNLMDMAKFEMPVWDANTDSLMSQYAMRMARYYDLIYDALTAEQCQTVLSKIAEVFEKGNSLFDNEVYFKNPQASHEWNCGKYMLSAALLTVGEIEGTASRKSSEEIVRSMVKYYINQTSPYQIEDGSYFPGIGYFRYMNMDLDHQLAGSGIISLWNKAYYRNQVYFPLYMYPLGSVGAFGDGSYVSVENDNGAYLANIYYRLAGNLKDPFAKWELDQIATKSKNNQPTERGILTAYFDLDGATASSPANLPKSKYFKDTGFAGLHSDLTDENRISLFFRSSPYGTYGHADADNNSFVIQAYGQRLAIDSGYYPYYLSPHHKNYTIQTYAHNAITFDGGKGQPWGDIEAEGKITGFVNSGVFDYVAGDATKAYKAQTGGSPNTLGKVKRHILYVRPDVFVVIDDLAAKSGETVNFEYWLQSEKEIPESEYTDSTVKIENNGAVLDATVQYPAQTTAEYLEGFTDLAGNSWQKEKDGDTNNTQDPDAQVHNRIVFKTPKVNQTKMVTTLSVHKSDETAQQITRTEYETYLLLTFADGTKVYINKGDADTTVTAENGAVSFTGAALAVKGDAVLLAEGTQTTINGVRQFHANEPVSAVSANGEISVSSMEQDNEVSVYYPNVTEVVQIKDAKQRTLSDRVTRNGITWAKDPEYVDLSLYNGQYQLKVTAQQPSRAEVQEFATPFVPSDDSSVTFGTVLTSPDVTVKEYGMLCHTSNPLPEYQTEGVIVLEGKSRNTKGNFGIELLGTAKLLGDRYYMRPYLICEKDGVLQPPVYASQSICVNKP